MTRENNETCYIDPESVPRLGDFSIAIFDGSHGDRPKGGLLPSDAHRIVTSLKRFGYLGQDPQTKKYRLGLELFKLGHLVHQRIELRETARPFLLRLSEATEATATLAIFDHQGMEIIFVEQVDSPSQVQIKLRIGSRTSPHATSVGKVLTAFYGPVGGCPIQIDYIRLPEQYRG